jgi:FixJ family two-component response regulator
VQGPTYLKPYVFIVANDVRRFQDFADKVEDAGFHCVVFSTIEALLNQKEDLNASIAFLSWNLKDCEVMDVARELVRYPDLSLTVFAESDDISTAAELGSAEVPNKIQAPYSFRNFVMAVQIIVADRDKEVDKEERQRKHRERWEKLRAQREAAGDFDEPDAEESIFFTDEELAAEEEPTTKVSGTTEVIDDQVKVDGYKDEINDQVKVKGFKEDLDDQVKVKGYKEDLDDIVKAKGFKEDLDDQVKVKGYKEDLDDIVKAKGFKDEINDQVKVGGYKEDLDDIVKAKGFKDEINDQVKVGGYKEDLDDIVKAKGFKDEINDQVKVDGFKDEINDQVKVDGFKEDPEESVKVKGFKVEQEESIFVTSKKPDEEDPLPEVEIEVVTHEEEALFERPEDPVSEDKVKKKAKGQSRPLLETSYSKTELSLISIGVIGAMVASAILLAIVFFKYKL